jgi:hypothetical protein
MRGSIELSGSLWTAPNSLRRRGTASGRKRTARLSTLVPSLRPWSTQWQDRDRGRETRARLHRSGLGGLGLEAKDVAMVGDDAESAVAGAQ